MAIALLEYALQLLYPPKCIVCRRVLQRQETDLCHRCREAMSSWQAPERNGEFFKVCIPSFYYQDALRQSVLRYKFESMRHYAGGYGRMMAMTLQRRDMVDFDLVTWVPVSKKRRRRRGYDQAQLLAQALARELKLPVGQTLRKIRDNPPQSSLQGAARRKGNVIGMYVTTGTAVTGLRILLVDDVITTGATLSECSRMLCTAGAKEVICATLAATPIAKEQVTIE